MKEIKLTKNQKELKVPFTTNKYDEELKDYDIHQTYSKSYGIEKHKDNIPFETTLTYDGYVRGRSALNITWRDNKNKVIYYSSMEVLNYAIKHNLIYNKDITGTFYFRKQGTSILLEMVRNV